MRKYLFELEIQEGNDKFWEEIQEKNATGCEQLRDVLEEALETAGFTTTGECKNCKLNLVRYSNNSNQ